MVLGHCIFLALMGRSQIKTIVKTASTLYLIIDIGLFNGSVMKEKLLLQLLSGSNISVFDSLMIIHARDSKSFEILTGYATSIAFDVLRNCKNIRVLQFQSKSSQTVTFEIHSLQCFQPEFVLNYFAS